MPNDSGITPPPMPWMTRATIRTPMVGETAASTEPAHSIARENTSMRSLPTASPIRPTMGVNTDAESRYAVSTQVTVVWSVFSWASMLGSTGTVSDCISAKEAVATARTINVTQYGVREDWGGTDGPSKDNC